MSDFEGVRYYGYFDTASKMFINYFASKNDLTAQRVSKEYCNKFYATNPLFIKDLETYYLFTINENTGAIVETNKNLIFSFKDFIELEESKNEDKK